MDREYAEKAVGSYHNQIAGGSVIDTKTLRDNDAVDDLTNHAEELHRRLQVVNRRLASILSRLGLYIEEDPSDESYPSSSGLRHKLTEISTELSYIETKLNSI